MFAGTMAGFQIPAGLLSERLGVPLVLAAGTALAGLGYCLAPFVGSYPALIAILLIAGLGASTQHPLASALVARAFAGARSLGALGTYNFAGDLGKMALPAAASLLVVLMPWRPSLALLGALGLVAALAILAAHAALCGRKACSRPTPKRRRPQPDRRAADFPCCCRSA